MNLGYEHLGSDNGLQSFRTPLATLHAFNGWADTFLATPPQGLRDYSISLANKLPFKWNSKIQYHRFHSEKGNIRFGDEVDILISRKIGKRWTFLTKYAFFNGRKNFIDTKKFWTQLEFNY